MNRSRLMRFGYREAISHLEIIDVDTLEITRVADFDCLIEAPNWLSDGRLLYNSMGLIYTIDIESHEIKRIDTGSCDLCNNDHVVSFDESTLAISCAGDDTGSRIYKLPLDGGVPELITQNAPSYLHGISPDGKTLAYCAERGGEYDIYTISSEGGDEKQLTFTHGLNDGPEYSPDGKHIWFNSVRDGNMHVFRMNADGSEQTRMTHDDRNNWFPHVSRDGKRIAYISYGLDVAPGDHPANKDVQLMLMNYDGTEGRVILKLFGGQGTLNVNSWSPDNKKIAYVRYDRV